MSRTTGKTPTRKKEQRNGTICLNKLVIGVFGALLFATQYQRAIRQWQRFLQNSLQSTEFQPAVEPLLSGFNLFFIVTGISLIALARLSTAVHVKRQPQINRN